MPCINIHPFWTFPHFVVLQPGSEIDLNGIFNLIYIIYLKCNFFFIVTQRLIKQNRRHLAAYIFTPLGQCMVEPPLATITVLWHMSLIALHVWIMIFCPSFLAKKNSQALSNRMETVGESLATDSQLDWVLCFDYAILTHSGSWFWRHFSVALAVCFESLSCWKVNLHRSLKSLADQNRFSSKIFLYLAPSVLPSTDQFPNPCWWQASPQHNSTSTMLP